MRENGITSLWREGRHSVFEFILTRGFRCQDSVPETVPDSPHLKLPESAMHRWEMTLEMLLIVVGLLCSIVFCIGFIRYHRQQRTSWTVDQINVCLIPLVLSATFAVIYFMFR